jgi:hypothetical protein
MLYGCTDVRIIHVPVTPAAFSVATRLSMCETSPEVRNDLSGKAKH